MPTVTCTPGGATDNCYVTAAQADAYFADTLRESDWFGYTADDRARALIQATRQIENLGGQKAADSATRSLFTGLPYDTSVQVLHFPRVTDTNLAGSVVVPQDMQSAVCEQAAWLLSQRDNPELVDRASLQAQGVRSLSVDGLSEQYGPTDVPPGIAHAAWVLVQGFIRRGAPTRVRSGRPRMVASGRRQ